MAVFGIDYRPQFVQSDVGAMQKRMDELQGAYDQSYMGALAAEDQYNALEVDPRDIGLKNEVIGNFRKKVQDIVTKYGGDWGAASKALAKQIISTKQDKFFQLAPVRRQLAEEQRRLIQQYGPDAIVTKDINKVSLRDKEGNYLSPEDLQYEVLHRGQFKEMMNRELGHLAKNVREGKFEASKDMPWQMERNIITGITEAEVMDVAKQGYEILKKQRPDLPDDIAFDIAMNEAKSYVGDIRTDFTKNEPWDIAQQKAMYKWQLDEKARRENPPVSPGQPFTTSLGAGRQGNKDAADKVMIDLKNFSEAAKAYYSPQTSDNVLKAKLDALKTNFRVMTGKATRDIGSISSFISSSYPLKSQQNYNNAQQGMLELYDQLNPNSGNVIKDKSGKLTVVQGRAPVVARAINSALDKSPQEVAKETYTKYLSKFSSDPTFVDLTKKRGMGPVQAASYVANERAQKYMMHDRYDDPVDPEISSKVIKQIKLRPEEYIDVVDVQTGKKVKDRDLRQALAKGQNTQVQFNNLAKTVRLTMDIGDKQVYYEMPIGNIPDNAINTNSSRFGKFLDNVYSPTVDMKEPIELNYGDKKFQYETTYNPATKTYDKVLVYSDANGVHAFSNSPQLIKSGKAAPLEYGLDLLGDFGATAVTDYYGRLLDYKDSKR